MGMPRTIGFLATLLISLVVLLIGTAALAVGGFPLPQERENLLVTSAAEKAVSQSGYDFYLVADDMYGDAPGGYFLISDQGSGWEYSDYWAYSDYWNGRVWGLDSQEMYFPTISSYIDEYTPGASYSYNPLRYAAGGIQGFDRGDVYVMATSSGISVLYHLVNRSYTHMASINKTGLTELWGLAPDDLFMAGANGVVAWYDGSSIQVLRSESENIIYDIWGTGHANVYAVGNGAALLHYDGQEWTQETIPVTSGTFRGIWGSGPDNIYVVGDKGLILHWNGVEWVNETTSNSNNFRGVYGSSANEVVVAGSGGAILRWNGTEWLNESTATYLNFWGVWGGLRVDGDQCWSAQYGDPAEGGGGTDGQVMTMLPYGGGVAVGGTFTHAGPDTMTRLGLWNGNNWSYLYAGSGPDGTVRDLEMYGGELIAAGAFTSIDGTPINCVAAYNGSTWRQLGGGLPAPVANGIRKLVLWGSNLVALGDADCNAYWNGTIWTLMPGVTGNLYTGGVVDDVLYAAGSVTAPGTAILQYSIGEGWAPLYGNFGTSPTINAFYEYQGMPLVGGLFSTIDGNNIRNLALFNGAAWVEFGGGSSGVVTHLGDYDGKLFVGGGFSQLGSVPAVNCAFWEGEDYTSGDGWKGLGSGISGKVEIKDSLELGGRYLVGGSFQVAGNHPSYNLASWKPDELTVSAPVSPPSEPGADHVVEVQVVGNPEVYPVILHYRSADGDPFFTSRMYPSPAKDGVFQGTVPGHLIGDLGFQFYITAGGGELSFTYPAGDPDDPDYVPAFTGVTMTDFSFTPPTAGQYVMMGVPFQPGPTTQSILTGAMGVYDKSQWRFGRWDPDNARYLEYPYTPDFAPGRGFWLIQKTTKAISVDGYSTSTFGGVTISLKPGWNMISTPYNFRIAKSSLVGLGGDVEDVLWARAGGIYVERTEMNPWQGYWVLNGGLVDAEITIPPTPAPVKSVEPVKASPPADRLWEIVIAAQKGDHRDPFNFAAVGASAEAGLDKQDYHEPPAMPGDVSFSFELLDGDRRHQLSTDVRCPFSQGEAWEAVLRIEGGGPVDLSFSGVAGVPAEFSVMLLTANGPVDLREVAATTVYVGDGGEARLRLAVGDPQFVAEQEQSLPRPFALCPNYPNPFNPRTIVSFTLPREARVLVDIYDMRGRLVQHLVDDDFEPGLHEVDWLGRDDNGRSVSAGVYFSRMRAEGFVQTRKMTLVR